VEKKLSTGSGLVLDVIWCYLQIKKTTVRLVLPQEVGIKAACSRVSSS